MPKASKEKGGEKTAIVFDVMPGADPIEPLPEEELDFNFLDEEEDEDGKTVENSVEEDDDDESDEATKSDDEDDEENEKSSEGDEEEEGEGDEDGKDGDEDDDSSEKDAEKAKKDKEEDPVDENKKAKEPMVPKSRLDQVLKKTRELQARVDALTKDEETSEEDSNTSEEFDFTGKEKEYQNALLEGETDRANEIRAEIRTAEREAIMREVGKTVTTSTSRQTVEEALIEAAKNIVVDFPMFDPESEVFNKELTQEVVELRDAYIASGKKPVDALSKAVEMVVRSNGLDSTEEGPDAKKEKVAAKKDRKSVKEKLDASKQQPAQMGGESARSKSKNDGDIDVEALTDEEWEALPEKTKSRLMGDIF